MLKIKCKLLLIKKTNKITCF